MANTYTQIYIHTVFAVSGRQSLISREHMADVCKYITGVVQHKKQKVMAINGMADHIHLLIGLSPDIALSDLMKNVKEASSRFINDKRWVRGHFSWQGGSPRFRIPGLRRLLWRSTSRIRSAIMRSVGFEMSI